MSVAKITLTGQQMLLNRKNESLFDFLQLPEDIDKDTCVDNIMLECGEFETLYSDPEFMRVAIGTWSNKHYRTFLKWVEALNLEYNPLDNYDRYEEWSDTRNKHDSLEDDTTGTSNIKNKTNNEGKVSAFDSSDYQPSEQSETDNESDSTNSNNLKHKGEEHEGSNHSGHIRGNIGVTSSMQLIGDQLELVRFNIINEITKLFMTELCICVYE